MPPPPDGLINQGKEKLDISRISELVCGCSWAHATIGIENELIRGEGGRGLAPVSSSGG